MGSLQLIRNSLLILLLVGHTVVFGSDLACRICHHVAYALNQPYHPSHIASAPCDERLPSEVCEAITRTKALMYGQAKLHMKSAICAPQYCARYSADCSCAIMKMLMRIAIANKDQPEEEFNRRLHLTCAQLDFLDPPCNMIVDEYGKEIYQLALKNTPADEASRQLGFCMSSSTSSSSLQLQSIGN